MPKMHMGLSPSTRTSNAIGGLTTRLLKNKVGGTVVDDTE